MLMELTHLQEVSDQLQRHAASPHHLPPASEQVITDIKGCDVTQWSLATPPSSPSLSLGSRKSSMCSISSLTSSSSGSCKSHPSPSGHPWHRSLSQVIMASMRFLLFFFVPSSPFRGTPRDLSGYLFFFLASFLFRFYYLLFLLTRACVHCA